MVCLWRKVSPIYYLAVIELSQISMILPMLSSYLQYFPFAEMKGE